METKVPQQIPTLLDRIAEGLGRGDEEKTKQFRIWLESVGRQTFGTVWDEPETCFNCQARMFQYTYTLGFIHARAMMKLAKEVQRKMATTRCSFTEANRIHISGLAGVLTPTEIDQKTQLKYLGLIAKVKDEDGKQKDSLWSITTWGFSFLRNDPVPASVTVWRKEVKYRSEAKTTLSAILSDAGTSAGAEGFTPYEYEVHAGRVA